MNIPIDSKEGVKKRWNLTEYTYKRFQEFSQRKYLRPIKSSFWYSIKIVCNIDYGSEDSEGVTDSELGEGNFTEN